jgi:hypothetical protein
MAVRMVHPEEAECVHASGRQRSHPVARDPPRERMHRERVQRKRKQPQDPVGQHRVGGRGVERYAKDAEADVMLGVGQRASLGVIDVRVEERRARQQRVRVPRERPHQKPRVAFVAGVVKAAEVHERTGDHERDRHIRQSRDDES